VNSFFNHVPSTYVLCKEKYRDMNMN
jgi:hypothetical protein